MKNLLKAALVSMIVVFGLTACKKPGPAETAGKQLDQAVEDVNKSIDKTFNDVDKAVKN
jgi:predicted small lipoprotein YifL